jgi:hypothetical protein
MSSVPMPERISSESRRVPTHRSMAKLILATERLTTKAKGAHPIDPSSSLASARPTRAIVLTIGASWCPAFTLAFTVS